MKNMKRTTNRKTLLKKVVQKTLVQSKAHCALFCYEPKNPQLKSLTHK
ncbi:cyclic lactone autoinducer peptide [Lactiplantibacillus pentosus]|jgi:hypothetical protein|nr:cyclic lactone autoinducer peptide [Lactiplantibacillus pentosus]MCT3301685.1 cyclic lactone autoinducer peptide [Lactiplantibacillus pentosus]PRO80056.1 cyclic lactone autoinducer peptide [Lactiplantibacillus pentosus]PRO82820.1 cyclic lactone autoinducer peptide [Lactiplantibacillus pentosus]PRO92723.1 cyclic lactone autoinducer peptide [Lactiplantibacillus pentosus]